MKNLVFLTLLVLATYAVGYPNMKKRTDISKAAHDIHKKREGSKIPVEDEVESEEEADDYDDDEDDDYEDENIGYGGFKIGFDPWSKKGYGDEKTNGKKDPKVPSVGFGFHQDDKQKRDESKDSGYNYSGSKFPLTPGKVYKDVPFQKPGIHKDVPKKEEKEKKNTNGKKPDYQDEKHFGIPIYGIPLDGHTVFEMTPNGFDGEEKGIVDPKMFHIGYPLVALGIGIDPTIFLEYGIPLTYGIDSKHFHEPAEKDQKNWKSGSRSKSGLIVPGEWTKLSDSKEQSKTVSYKADAVKKYKP